MMIIVNQYKNYIQNHIYKKAMHVKKMEQLKKQKKNEDESIYIQKRENKKSENGSVCFREKRMDVRGGSETSDRLYINIVTHHDN